MTTRSIQVFRTPPLGPFSIDFFCPFTCFHALEIVPFTLQAFGLHFNGVANVAFDTMHSINFHPFFPMVLVVIMDLPLFFHDVDVTNLNRPN
jgi:hypothetical protein